MTDAKSISDEMISVYQKINRRIKQLFLVALILTVLYYLYELVRVLWIITGLNDKITLLEFWGLVPLFLIILLWLKPEVNVKNYYAPPRKEQK